MFQVRRLVSEGSWADGLNVHGAHTNIVIENCNLSSSGDDTFAMWSDADRMTKFVLDAHMRELEHASGGDSTVRLTETRMCESVRERV